jgi:hypothetical protein
MAIKHNHERIYWIAAAVLLIAGSLIILGIQLSAFGQQGQGVTIKLNSAYFTSPSGNGNHQVKVFSDYKV